MGRPKGSVNPPKLNFYGLGALGYAESIPLTGDFHQDQIKIESICFRIGHRRKEGGLGKFGHFKRIVDLIWNDDKLGSHKKCLWHKWSEKQARELCRNDELGVAGSSSSGKSDMAALWVVVNYIVDPTHVLALVMSTSIDGAKKRIWKTLREYIDALPDYPGKPLWSTNRIEGPNYAEDGYGESSGIYLLAGEKAKEKDSLEKLIGIKAPKTGDADESFEALKARPEFADLVATRSEEELEDLLPRLMALSDDRTGKIIFIIDEATGVVDSILNAYKTNMKPGNPGHIQLVMLGNPNLHFDVLGRFCRPSDGWDNLTLEDYEWETKTGGLVIRFNGEKNPRITERNERLTWMLTRDGMKELETDYGGKTSLYYYRFVLGTWCPQGDLSGVYSQGDIEMTGSMEAATWGFQKPVMHSSLDPSFSAGGDKPACTFFLYGKDQYGRSIMEVVRQMAIPVDARDKKTPVPYQVANGWRKECRKMGASPECAAFDATGGGVTFAAIIHKEWSPRVQAVTSGGKASTNVLKGEKHPDGKPLRACDRFYNKATEMWYAAHPFLRAGQIRGITAPLAKEICSRKNADSPSDNARVVKVESKKIYIRRENHSPDDSDSFFVGLEHLKTRHRFKPLDLPSDEAPDPEDRTRGRRASDPWETFKARARKIHTKTHLPR